MASLVRFALLLFTLRCAAASRDWCVGDNIGNEAVKALVFVPRASSNGGGVVVFSAPYAPTGTDEHINIEPATSLFLRQGIGWQAIFDGSDASTFGPVLRNAMLVFDSQRNGLLVVGEHEYADSSYDWKQETWFWQFDDSSGFSGHWQLLSSEAFSLTYLDLSYHDAAGAPVLWAWDYQNGPDFLMVFFYNESKWVQAVAGTPTLETVSWTSDDVEPHHRANLQYVAPLKLLLAYNSQSGALTALRGWSPGLVHGPWQTVAVAARPPTRLSADLFWSRARQQAILTPGASMLNYNDLISDNDYGEHSLWALSVAASGAVVTGAWTQLLSGDQGLTLGLWVTGEEDNNGVTILMGMRTNPDFWARSLATFLSSEGCPAVAPSWVEGVAWGTFALTAVLILPSTLLFVAAIRALQRSSPRLPWPLQPLTPTGERSAEFSLNMLSIALLHSLLLLSLYLLSFLAFAGEGVLAVDAGAFASVANAMIPPTYKAFVGVLMAVTLGTGVCYLLCYVFVIVVMVEPSKKHARLDIVEDVEFVNSGKFATLIALSPVSPSLTVTSWLLIGSIGGGALQLIYNAVMANIPCRRTFLYLQAEISQSCKVADFVMGPLVLLLSQLLITKLFAYGVRRSYPKASILAQQNRLLAAGVSAGITFSVALLVEPFWATASGATTWPEVAQAVQDLVTLYQQSLVLYFVRAVGQQLVSHRLRKHYRAHSSQRPSGAWKIAYCIFDSDDEGHAPDAYLQPLIWLQQFSLVTSTIAPGFLLAGAVAQLLFTLLSLAHLRLMPLEHDVSNNSSAGRDRARSRAQTKTVRDECCASFCASIACCGCCRKWLQRNADDSDEMDSVVPREGSNGAAADKAKAAENSDANANGDEKAASKKESDKSADSAAANGAKSAATAPANAKFEAKTSAKAEDAAKADEKQPNTHPLLFMAFASVSLFYMGLLAMISFLAALSYLCGYGVIFVEDMSSCKSANALIGALESSFILFIIAAAACQFLLPMWLSRRLWPESANPATAASIPWADAYLAYCATRSVIRRPAPLQPVQMQMYQQQQPVFYQQQRPMPVQQQPILAQQQFQHQPIQQQYPQFAQPVPQQHAQPFIHQQSQFAQQHQQFAQQPMFAPPPQQQQMYHQPQPLWQQTSPHQQFLPQYHQQQQQQFFSPNAAA